MSTEDVWMETIHESERRAGKKSTSVIVSEDEDKVPAPDTKKRPATSKHNPSKNKRGQEGKRAA